MTNWINCWLGTTSEVELTEPGVIILDVRDLVDGLNPPEDIVLKLMAGKRLHSSHYRFIVRCVLGISRSPAIAAGILAYLEGKSYDEELAFVKSKVWRANPNEGIIASTKEALELIQHPATTVCDD